MDYQRNMYICYLYKSGSETCAVEEIESLLLDQEGRIEKHSKDIDSCPGSVNIAA